MNVVEVSDFTDDLNTQGRKHPFILFGELSVTNRKDWLVRGFLGAGEGSAVFGKPGDGKSVLVQDMALHIAAGEEWHGRTVKRGAVLYVALARRELVKRRAIAFRKKHAPSDLPFAVFGGVFDLRDPAKAQELSDAAQELAKETGTDVVLIVIDTLSRALCGGDENSPKDMGAIVRTTSILQEIGAHVLWVHHTPTDGSERLRGHGALLGAMDTTVSVTRGGTIRTATVIKANDSEEGEQVSFTLESVVIDTDEYGQDTTAPVVVPAEAATTEDGGDQRLKPNHQTMYGILSDARHPLSTDEWNARARDAGLGRGRRADLHDFRTTLKKKGLVWETASGWSVKR